MYYTVIYGISALEAVASNWALIRTDRNQAGVSMADRGEGTIGRTVRLMTIKQAAEYLGTTPGTLYTKIWRREIPFIKLGRSVRFDIKDLEELIKMARVVPQDLDHCKDLGGMDTDGSIREK